MSQRVPLLRLTLLAGVLAAWSSSALALNPALDISQYAHTSWKIREGFVESVIRAIAQTSDGYLWLGTDAGLYRFDGIRSVAWQPSTGQRLPSDLITSLLATRDGALWIATDKGLACWKAGTLTRYVETAGHRIGKLLETRDGSVWTTRVDVNRRALCEIRNESIRCDGGDRSPSLIGLYEDRRGNLWVGAGNGIWRWKPGAPTFFPQTAQPNGIQGLAEDADGALLISEIGGLRRFVDGKTEMIHPFPASMQQFEFTKLLRDRDGGLWVGSLATGVVHVHNGRTDVFATSDGLSGGGISALFEDREGSVWVATVDGLDRFHDTAVATLTAHQGLSNDRTFALSTGKDSSVWIATSDGLNRWQNGRVTVYRDPAPLAGSITSVFQDPSGRVWYATRRGGGYLDGNRVVPIKGLPDAYARGIVADTQNIWFVYDKTLFRVSPDGSHIQETSWATMNRGQLSSVSADPTRRGVWLGFPQGGILRFADGRIVNSFTPGSGLPQGTVRHLRLDPDDTLWVATDGGLSRVSDGHVATLNSRNGLPCDVAQWLVEDDTYAFWLGMRCGLVRIDRAEMSRWISAPEQRDHTIRSTVFDSADGFRTRVGTYTGQPAVKAADGRLWFVSVDGVSVVDPRHLPFNRLPPPVAIESITADRTAYDASGTAGEPTRLPALVRDLQIDYTALSLVVPEKNRFRYKLEGYDRDWQDAGTRRQAFYTKLPPRDYRFRVVAANNSGVWNETGASLEFTVLPAYYQTTWFRVTLAAVFVALLGAAYQLRVRQLARHYTMRLDARVSERTRIARDLHDTLLQNFQGVLLNFHAATFMLPDRPDQARTTLVDAIEQASQAITEARDAVQGLRTSAGVTGDLARAIGALGDDLTDRSNHQAPQFTVNIEGETRDLSPLLGDEVYRIAGEALRNAFRHADARRIEVEIHYDRKQFRLRVRDDGKGIDPNVLATGGRNGHYGLAGMHERAAVAGGTLDVWSELADGTEIELAIPAAIAYAKSADSKSADAKAAEASADAPPLGTS